ncbi:MAG: hypothetical protein LBH11_03170 [Propionibacteriaceae bacterium]|nr:hypothetical protein [Propionibacteriaceae bacterium]
MVPVRVTNDGDAVLDVRAEPTALASFTEALYRLGFRAAGTSAEEHQHRWVRGDASIDVLIPRHVGPRAAARQGVSGGTTVQIPGGQAALDRAEPLLMRVGEAAGVIRRPTLQGAIALKAAAYHTPDSLRERHLADVAILATLVRPADRVGDGLTNTERRRISRVIAAIESRPDVVRAVAGWQAGLARLRVAITK